MADILIASLGTALAILEVQIEGPHGWAAKLPTWRPTGPIARAASRLLGGKPITGYHLVLNVFLLLMVHLPIAVVGWSWSLEAWALSRYAFLLAFWDVQWFVLNPHYGWARFRPGTVWWHHRWVGPIPLDYLQAVALSALLGAWFFWEWLGGLAVFLAQTVVVALVGEWVLRGHPDRLRPMDPERPRTGPEK